MTQLLIKDILLIDPTAGREEKIDIRVKNGNIAALEKSISPEKDDITIDGKNLWLTSGLVDIHTHLRDFGQSDREDIATGTKAAAAGGYTVVTAMANTEPPIDSTAIMSLLLKNIQEKAVVKVLPVACVTKAMAGQELTPIIDLARMGAAAFSDDGMPVTNLSILRRALEYTNLVGKPIISHAEDHHLSHGGAMHEGVVSTRLGLPGIPHAAESACVAREIEVTAQTGGRLHFGHISTARSVDLIRQAKAKGINVTADTTPHHLVLSADDIKDYDTSFKMNPPLRTREDQKALVEGIKDGTIDAIATDHAPHTRLDKSLPFDKAPFGVIGLETALPLVLEVLHQNKTIPLAKLISLFTQKPSSIIGLNIQPIAVGQTADFTIIDPTQSWRYDTSQGFSKSINSPFHLRNMVGKVLLTYCQGKLVYQDQKHLKPRQSGNLQTAN